MTKKCRFFEPLAAEIAGGSSIRDAAKAVGCSETLAYRTNSMPEFRQRVSEIRSDITTGVVGVLTSSAQNAVETLRQLLSNENEPSVRLQAAKAILAALGPMSELGELRQRLDALEQADAKLRIAK